MRTKRWRFALIVLGIALLIAVIAIPNLFRAKIAAYESSEPDAAQTAAFQD